MELRKSKIAKNYLESIVCSFAFILSFLFSPISFAADSLSYSGRLVKADGSPVSGPVNLKVDLAYTDFPNTILCSQNFNSVVLSNGVFHLKLDLVCPGPPVKTVTEILSAVPVNFAAALRVSDLSNNKIYAFQEIHSMPFATVSESAKQLAQLGAVNGEVLKWNDTTKKWEPGTPGGGGTVTNITVTSPLAVVNGATTPALSMAQATATVDGYLSAADWNNFNNKIGVVAGGTATQFYRGDKSWQTLNTDAVPESGATNLYFNNARALGVPLGATLDVVSLTGAISSADTVLSAFGRTQNQINSINTNSSGYVTKMGTSTMVAAGTIDAQAGFVLVGTPGSINDATPRGYVNDQDALKVSKIGDSMSGVLTLDSDLKIKSGTTTNYVTIKGHATSDNYNLFLPSTDGNPGEVLKTDGAGNLAWINPASVAAGSATVDSTAIVNGTIVDADIANTTISYAKLNLTDGDIPLVKLNGVSDATKYLRADKSWQTLNGAAVANTPAGSIAATSTQAALNELDTEKEAAVTAGLASDYYKGNKTWSNLGTDVRASQLTGLAAGTNTALVATDSILTAFQNTQAQINSKQNTISKTTDQDLKSVRLYGANATNYVELTAGALTANRSLIFPDANGSSGQVLTTNGAGVLSWTTAATTGSAVGGDLSGTIANAQLGAGVVGNAELAADAVTSAKILDGTIVNADLANTTITYAKLNLTDGDIPLAKLNGASDATKYLRGDKSWSTFATDAIASALAGFTPFATKTDITATDSIFTAFRKTQKQLDDIDGDYVSKSGNNTVTGTFNISGITAFLNIPTPTGTTLSEAANVDYVKTYVGTMGQWTKGSGGNAADIYFNTGNVGIGTVAPYGKLHSSTSDAATSIDLTANPSLVLQNLNATSGVFNTLMFANSGGFGSAAISVPQTQTTNKGDNLVLQTKTSTGGGWNLNQLVLTSAGNVGIGTATPAEKLSVVGDISVTGQVTSKDFFEKTVTIADGWAIGDYVEMVQGSPSGSGASSYWEVHIGGTRGNWTEGSTYLVAGTHSTDSLWREAANTSDNTYVGNSKCFTVDVKGNGNTPQFRIRALKASTSCGTPASLPLNFRIRSIGLNNGWTSLSATGVGATVVGMQSMGLNWSLFTGNPQANAKAAIHANSAGNVGIGTLTPASKLSVAGTIESTTGGVKYPDGSTQATSSFGPVFSAYASTSPSTANSVWVKVPYNSVEFDPDTSLDTANQRIRPTKAGYYRISMTALVTQIGSGGTTNYLSLYKNGAVIKNTSLLVNYTASYTQTLQVESTVYLNGTTDYLEGWWTSNSTNASTIVAGVANTFISGNYLRP